MCLEAVGCRWHRDERGAVPTLRLKLQSTMGGSPSKPASSATAAPQGSSCPVLESGSQSSGTAGECPVKSGKVYNVYAQEINPLNQMPAQANQSPWPGQSVPISTERVQSNIPKNGTDASWTYPSPQMFYNALKRMGMVMIAESSCPCELVSYGTSSRPLQDENVQETDMESVVAIHNNMNENTWCEILNWERLHSAKCDSPKLSRFFGRVSLTDFVMHKQVT